LPRAAAGDNPARRRARQLRHDLYRLGMGVIDQAFGLGDDAGSRGLVG